MRLQNVGTVQYLKHLTLTNTGGSDEASSVQPQPEGTIWTTLIGNVAGVVAAVDICRPAFNPFDQLLLQFNTSSVFELDMSADGKGFRKIPGSILSDEVLIRTRFGSAATHAAEGRIQSGMPGRLACFIRPVHQIEAGRK